MQILQSKAVNLLKTLGVDTADTWDLKTLQDRLNKAGGVARFVTDPPPVVTEEEQALLDDILDAQKKGPVEILADTAVVAQKVKVVKTKTVKYPKGWADWDEGKKAKYWKKHPRVPPAKGVAAVVVKELRHAGKLKKPKPRTRAELLRILQETFPDHDAVKMETNLQNLVPGRLKDVYGLTVEKVRLTGPDDRKVWGFYIPPETAKAAEPAPELAGAEK